MPDTSFTPSPFPALAAAAAVTTDLRLAPWVLAAPLRTPGVVARETSALQLLSAGRFELGIGTGRPDAAAEAERLGMPWGSAAERLAVLLQTVEAVRGLDARVSVLVAAGGPKGLAAAGGVADTVALALSPTSPVDAVRTAADRARAQGDPEIGLSISGVGGRPVGYLARTPAEALAEAASVLRGDPAAMAEQLGVLGDDAGVTFFAVSEEQADEFAPVIALLR